MQYTILETRIEFYRSKITKVIVLVDMNEDGKDVRACYAINRPVSGYTYIIPNAEVCEKLLQSVAALGMTMSEKERDKTFNGWKKRYNDNRQTSLKFYEQ